MKDLLKVVAIVLLAIVFFPLVWFMLKTYGEDTNGTGWYQDLWSRGWPSVALAIVLWPVYFLIKIFLELTFEAYHKLGE